ncbi:competence type IV pilus major pilin ComGC [Natranaerobius trueperi]|uniref:Prepilin-type cleavage/methylation domain-containing protein n=1 Tax=Natranaerobius trueperi TaxID=759412 RepID=A0A226BX98_9FIRM|nr:type II secretion system protein [Natranaerobius trueperi]OWZ83402.1 hypothetical protein CDO51_08875 [Natranaerobius trueperi]
MKKLIYMIEKAKRDESGFTLVELLIVVAIIGVLVAIIVPVMGGQTETARENANDANIRTIKSAISAYYAEEGSLDELDESALKEYIDVDEIECPWDDSVTGINIDINDADKPGDLDVEHEGDGEGPASGDAYKISGPGD